MDFSVRPAGPDDIPQLCDLLAELFSIESDFSPDRHRQTRGLALLLGDTSESAAVFVAEKDGEIIGVCSVQTLVSTAEGGPVGLVEDVIVRKQHRRKGVGKRLLSEVTGWCARKKMSRLQLLRDADNIDALKFYEANGWSDTGLLCMRKLI